MHEGCGEAVHRFCLDADLPERASRPFIRKSADAAYRFASARVGQGERPRRGKMCTIRTHCENPESNDHTLFLCDNCNRMVHHACMSVPRAESSKDAFKCVEGAFC